MREHLPTISTIDTVIAVAKDRLFEVTTAPRGAEIENIITISKIRSMMPKARVVRLAQRESGLATETIRRVQ